MQQSTKVGINGLMPVVLWWLFFTFHLHQPRMLEDNNNDLKKSLYMSTFIMKTNNAGKWISCGF